MKITTKSAPEVVKVARLAFPDYRGRKFRIDATEKFNISNSYWSGGTKSDYVAIKFPEMVIVELPDVNPMRHPGYNRCFVNMMKDVIVVEHIIFCGHDCGLLVHVHPCNINKLLTA